MNILTCKKWDFLEITLSGPERGNPFVEQYVRGTFSGRNENVTCDGFYDGNGIIGSVSCRLLRENIPIG